MEFNPEVMKVAMARTGCSGPDEFGWKFLNKSGTTVRNYISGKTVPSVETLMILKKLTGLKIEEMVTE